MKLNKGLIGLGLLFLGIILVFVGLKIYPSTLSYHTGVPISEIVQQTNQMPQFLCFIGIVLIIMGIVLGIIRFIKWGSIG